MSGQHIIHPPGVTREARYRASNWSDVIDAGDLGHLLETLGVSIKKCQTPTEPPVPAIARA